MRIRLLGTVSVRGADGAELRVAGLRLRGLLARLALDAGRPVDTATLVDALWGAEPPSTANALQSLATRLRRALGSDRIRSTAGGYRLDVAPEVVDASEFTALRGAADAEPDRDKARDLLERALALWSGPALADLGGLPFAGPAAARLAEARAAAAEELARRGLADGVPDAGREVLTAILAEQPLRETAAVALARGLHAGGRQADALAVLDRTRTALADELGVDPGPELRRARTELLHDAPARPLPDRAPAGRRTRPPRHRSPALTSFIGRDDDLARLRALVATGRLVTVTGPGGAGKTRIVSEVVRELDGAVAVAELAPLTGPDRLAATVLHAVGGPNLARTDLDDDPRTRLRAAVADRDLLLVLDNCEHLIDAAADLTHDLLTSAPGLRVLATSREPLGVPGELLHPLGALDDAQAVRLFTERAAAVAPGFAPTTEDTEVIAGICGRLDGQPLPIELAAARVRTLSLREIADRLADRFRLLVSGARTALPRHQTLRAVVDWSWDLLGDAERTLAERFGIFAGAVDADAVETVCGVPDPGGDPLDLLAALVEKSLVVTVPGGNGGPTRYRMLETIREYAAARLADGGEAAALARAHAEWVLGILEPGEPMLRTAAQLEWLTVLRSVEGEAVRALNRAVDDGRAEQAHRLLAALVWSWVIRGELPTLHHWSDRVATLPLPAGVLAVAVTSAVRAVVVATFHTGEGVLTAAEEVLVHPVGDGPHHPIAVLARPIAELFRGGDRAEMTALLADDDPWIRAAAAQLVAVHAENEGEPDVQRTHLRLAHRLFTEIGDRFGLGMTLAALGELEDLAGDPEAAATAYREAVALSVELGNLEDLPQFTMRLAHLAARSGDTEAALAHLADAVDGGSHPREWVGWMHADIERRAGRPDRAREILDGLPEEAGDGPGRQQRVAGMNVIIAAVELDIGRLDTARTHLDRAADAARESRDGPVLGNVAEMAARWALAAGDAERAGELLGVAIDRRGALHRGDPEVLAVLDGVRAALGPDGCDAAIARGRAIGRDTAPRP